MYVSCLVVGGVEKGKGPGNYISGRGRGYGGPRRTLAIPRAERRARTAPLVLFLCAKSVWLFLLVSVLSPQCGAPASAFPLSSRVVGATPRRSEGRAPSGPCGPPSLHGPDPEGQCVPQAESPGSGLLRTRRGRGAEDEPGHPAGAGVPGDARRSRGARGPTSCRAAVFYGL